MGFLNKLLFWKHEEDDFDFDDIAKQNSSQQQNQQPSFPKDDLGIPDTLGSRLEESFSSNPPDTTTKPGNLSLNNPPSYNNKNSSQQNNFTRRDIELINSKLDTIKALVSSLDQRMYNLEKITNKKEKPKNDLW
jgi:hypothetical protein